MDKELNFLDISSNDLEEFIFPENKDHGNQFPMHDEDRTKMKNILIVDDDDDICESCSAWLEELGHRVTIAKNYDNGLREYKKSIGRNEGINSAAIDNFDIVLLDDEFPTNDHAYNAKLEGLRLAEEISYLRNDQKILFIPVWSRKVFFEITSTWEKIPVILPKPFDKEEVVSMVEETNLYSLSNKLTEKLKELNLW